MTVLRKRKKKSKLTFDGFYFDGKNSYDLYKDENGNIIRKKKKKVNVC